MKSDPGSFGCRADECRFVAGVAGYVKTSRQPRCRYADETGRKVLRTVGLKGLMNRLGLSRREDLFARPTTRSGKADSDSMRISVRSSSVRNHMANLEQNPLPNKNIMLFLHALPKVYFHVFIR